MGSGRPYLVTRCAKGIGREPLSRPSLEGSHSVDLTLSDLALLSSEPENRTQGMCEGEAPPEGGSVERVCARARVFII